MRYTRYQAGFWISLKNRKLLINEGSRLRRLPVNDWRGFSPSPLVLPCAEILWGLEPAKIRVLVTGALMKSISSWRLWTFLAMTMLKNESFLQEFPLSQKKRGLLQDGFTGKSKTSVRRCLYDYNFKSKWYRSRSTVRKCRKKVRHQESCNSGRSSNLEVPFLIQRFDTGGLCKAEHGEYEPEMVLTSAKDTAVLLSGIRYRTWQQSPHVIDCWCWERIASEKYWRLADGLHGGHLL